MQNELKPSFPPILLVLDVLGTILLGAGFAKLAGGIDLIPAGFRFENYGLAFIFLGIALMLPFVVHVIKKPRTLD